MQKGKSKIQIVKHKKQVGPTKGDESVLLLLVTTPYYDNTYCHM